MQILNFNSVNLIAVFGQVSLTQLGQCIIYAKSNVRTPGKKKKDISSKGYNNDFSKRAINK